MDKKIIAVVAIIFLLTAFVFGWLVGQKMSPKNAEVSQKSSGGKTEQAFQAGWEAAEKRMAETGLCQSIGEAGAKGVSGAVVSVGSGEVEVKITPLEPLADAGLDTRVVKINPETKIYQLVLKDQQVLQKEVDEYNKSLEGKDINNLPPAPEMQTKKEVGMAELKTGQSVVIYAAEDIKNAKNFVATEVSIQPAQFQK